MPLLLGEPEPERDGENHTDEREEQDRCISAVLRDTHLVAYFLRETAAGSAALGAYKPPWLSTREGGSCVGGLLREVKWTTYLTGPG